MDQKHINMIERIYSEIVGDEYTKGLIPKVNRNTEKIKQHDTYFKVIILLFSTISALFLFWDNLKNMFN
jgi:hypothetical protein